jgi:hypothetical protein
VLHNAGDNAGADDVTGSPVEQENGVPTVPVHLPWTLDKPVAAAAEKVSVTTTATTPHTTASNWGEPITVLLHKSNVANTGVWAGFGAPMDEKQTVSLNWAAAGLKLYKGQADARCSFVDVLPSNAAEHEHTLAVVTETVNVIKFQHGEVLEDPSLFTQTMLEQVDEQHTLTRPPTQVLFYFEPIEAYPRVTIASEIRKQFDIIVEPSTPVKLISPSQTILPVTMTCPWFRATVPANFPPSLPNSNLEEQTHWLETYFHLQPLPFAEQDFLIHHNEHGAAAAHSDFLSSFRDLIQAAGDEKKSDFSKQHKQLPDLQSRIEALNSYRFTLVTEFVVQRGWVEMEFSQAFAAGSVPVYLGAPDAADFAPGGRRSYIDVVRDGWLERGPQALVKYLLNMSAVEHARYLSWKTDRVVSASFQWKLSQCVYYAEDRLCDAIIQKRLIAGASD